MKVSIALFCLGLVVITSAMPANKAEDIKTHTALSAWSSITVGVVFVIAMFIIATFLITMVAVPGVSFFPPDQLLGRPVTNQQPQFNQAFLETGLLAKDL